MARYPQSDDMANDTPPKLCMHHVSIPTALASSNILSLIKLNNRHYVECSGNGTLPSIDDVFNRLQSP